MSEAWFLGVDGGASGTRASVIDSAGRRLGYGEAGPSNARLSGWESAGEQVALAARRAIEDALARTRSAQDPPRAPRLSASEVEDEMHALHGGVGDDTPAFAQPEPERRRVEPVPAHILDTIKFACFCLATLDLPSDWLRWLAVLEPRLPHLPILGYNDTAAALRAGSRDGTGAVVVAGSGFNAAAIGPKGRANLFGVEYELGNRGGGFFILRDALHWAFRAHEATGRPTRLTTELPAALGIASMDDLAEVVAAAVGGPPAEQVLFVLQLVVPLVFRLADEGDAVCQDILIDLGRDMGRQVAGVITRAGLAGLEPLPLVYSGGIFKADNPLLLDALRLEVHRVAPRADLRRPLMRPSEGAALLAMEEAGMAAREVEAAFDAMTGSAAQEFNPASQN